MDADHACQGAQCFGTRENHWRVVRVDGHELAILDMGALLQFREGAFRRQAAGHQVQGEGPQIRVSNVLARGCADPFAAADAARGNRR
ncbi:hypothetical protein D3C86_1992510 [compost metagenome]